MARETGSVKWFSNEKGYGFIKRRNGEDVFVHYTDIIGDGFRSLKEGEDVDFEVIIGDRGAKAHRVAAQGEEEMPGVGASGSEDQSLASQLKEKLGRLFNVA
jgi:CspA family cold shock protein